MVRSRTKASTQGKGQEPVLQYIRSRGSTGQSPKWHTIHPKSPDAPRREANPDDRPVTMCKYVAREDWVPGTKADVKASIRVDTYDSKSYLPIRLCRYCERYEQELRRFGTILGVPCILETS